MIKGLCKTALAALFAAACGGDLGVTEPVPSDATLLSSGSGVLAIGVDPKSGATIETNKDDYAPGEIVHLVGRGWAAGETVNLHMTEEPNTHADVDTNVVADANGGFSIHFYDVQVHDLLATFTLTATGGNSGSVAVVTFTDGTISGASIVTRDAATCTSAVGTVVAGSPICAFSTFTISGSGTTHAQFRWQNPSGTVVAISQRTPSFGNGETGSKTYGANFTPSVAGTWTVLLCESNNSTIPGGCPGPSQRATQTFTVSAANSAPTANANGPYAGNEGSAIPLSSAGSGDTDGTIASYSWSYTKNAGHGGASCSISNVALESPTITCNDNGTFTVSLTVTDDDGATSAPSTATLTVSNVKPTATSVSTTPTSPNFGATFTATLNGGDDVSSNDETVGLEYKFDCGSGYGAYGPSNSTTCTANSPNSQTVKATIKDKDGGENEYQTTVSVNNAVPVANAGGNKNGVEGSAVSLNGTASTDADGTINTWAWSHTVVTADPGTTCSLTNANQATASITCTDNGAFTVTLTVTDDDGATNSQTVDLTLTNANPTANAGGPYSGAEGSAIQLNGSGDDPGNNDDAALTYAWSVSSSGIDAGGACTLSSATAQNPTITCTDDSNGGNFTVSLVVSDDDGGTSTSASANLTISNANPVANAGTGSGLEGAAIQLNGSGDDPGNNDDAGLTYLWSVNTSGIDAGGTCTLSSTTIHNPTVTCTDNGTFVLSLTVSDDDGGSHIDTGNLTVNNANPTADAAGPYTTSEGSGVAISGSKADQGANDTHTFAWSYTLGAGVDVGTTCTFTNAAALSTSVSCNDNGTITLTLTVTDDDGGVGTADATLTLSNVAPAANPGGPYSGNEGAAVPLSGSATDAGTHDTHSFAWSYAPQSGVDAGATCSFSAANAQNPTITCTDDGVYLVKLIATDDDGAASTQASATLTVGNVNPTANAGGPYSSSEAVPAAISGAKADQGANDTHTAAWSYSGPAGATCTFTDAAALSTSVTCNDNGTFTLTLTITDDDAGVGTSNATFSVSNTPPTITEVNGPLAPVALGSTNSVTWKFTDPGSDTWTCTIDWDSNNTFVAATYVAPKSCSASTASLTPGLYSVTVKVSDDDGGSDTETLQAYVVIYDPNGGFVTGGGWINSEAGFYRLNTSAAGKANFGFVSKYQPGRTVPTGNTEFQFHAGDLNFKSTVYEWLVVAGSKAMYKGEGTIAGRSGTYMFLLSAIDGSPDKFRIKIWNKSSGELVYDTLPVGAADDADPATTLGGGSIVVHTKK